MKLAGAPISWGVCEVPGWGLMLDRDKVLGEMAELGMTATELGPPDYLPTDPAVLKALLGEYALTLVGGFLAVALHKPGAADEADRTAKLLAACGGEVLVLAAATGQDGYDDKPVLSDEEWRTLVRTAGRSGTWRRDTGCGPCSTRTWGPTWRRRTRSNGSSATPTWTCAWTPGT
ncbi:hypothetical protein GCM10029964_119180 [Kibdelosporangium lantanae]